MTLDDVIRMALAPRTTRDVIVAPGLGVPQDTGNAPVEGVGVPLGREPRRDEPGEPPPIEASHSAPPDVGASPAPPEPLDPKTDRMTAFRFQPDYRALSEQRVAATPAEGLGGFASQFAGGGQGQRSYNHSLRPERGTLVR
jgi:hypothetical protein